MATPSGSSESHPWPSPRQAWYAVAIFALALAISFLDRSILSLLIGPIKRDLGLSDFKASLLIGFAFVFFYMFMGLPIARLVDTKSRRLIIGCGVALWSLMTSLCGLAQNFTQLFIARIGVGVGEACNGPATFSMLADLFPRERLPRAIAVLNLGFVAGTGLALLLGGAVIHLVSTLPSISVPGLGALHPWQVTFILVGIPGLFVAALYATVPEPARRGLVAGTAARTLPIRDVWKHLTDNRAAYVPMFLGLGLNVIVTFGNQTWTPEFFIRTHHWTAVQAGVTPGMALICAAPFGLMVGSLLAERFTRQGYADSNMRVTLIGIGLAAPCAALFPLMPTPQLAVAILALHHFFAMFVPGPFNAALQIITPNQMRGQTTALFLFVFNVVGFGIGPTFVATLTNYVFHDEAMLRYSMAVTAAIMGTASVVTLWSGLKAYGAAYGRVTAIT